MTITAPPPLASARLALRPPTPADAERLADLAGDRDVARMTSSIPHPYGLSDARAFIDNVRVSDPDVDPTFAVDLPGEGLIGALGFRMAGATLGPEVGYWLGKPYWGRGYATEALRRAMGWAREDWRVRCVVAGHFADNPASGAVLIKSGFLYTGETPLTFSLARDADVPCRRMVWLA